MTEATKYIEEYCNQDSHFKRNIEVLDKYDFSDFFSEGLNLWTLRENIENAYDKDCRKQYQMYLFDYLSGYDTCMYFASRYNVWFQEYTDWVVRHENGINEKTRRRTENSSRKMEE